MWLKVCLALFVLLSIKWYFSKNEKSKLNNLMITKKEGKDTIYKSIWSLNGLRSGPNQYQGDTTPNNEPKTMSDLLKSAHIKFHNKEMFGHRDLIRIVPKIKKGKTLSFYELSEYKWMTMSLFYNKVVSLGKYLSQSLQEQQVLCIFASTSVEWQIVAHAAWSQNITISTAYDTLGAEGLEYSLKETEATHLYCTSDQFPVLLKVLPNVKLTKVLYKQGLNVSHEQSQEFILEINKFCKVVNLNDAINDKIALSPSPPRHPKPDDVACLMYTSGSTGPPKGVEIRHFNMMATLGSALDMLNDHIDENDVFLAYLPLAHILELVIENGCIYLGLKMGYGSPRTITDQSIINCNGDLKELGPTVLVGVPQVWDTIRKSILSKLSKKSKTINKIFWGAYNFNLFCSTYNIPLGFLTNPIFKQIKKETGGNLKLALSGGSALNPTTQSFLTNILCPIFVGYGMTETVGLGCLMTPDIGFLPGVVGIPMSSIEVKLVNVPDTDYKITNDPPQGEIYLRGPSITTGYYKQQLKSKEAFEGAWLKTGDIAEIIKLPNTKIQVHNEVDTATGVLKIIDRAKNLVKLSNGEYIALEKLESIYKQNEYCLNVMVAADSECKLPIIVVHVNEVEFMRFAQKHGKVEFKEARVSLRFELLKALLVTGKEYGLKGTNLIGGVVISDEEWTPENGLLTAAMKLQRRHIIKRFDAEINEAYKLLK